MTDGTAGRNAAKTTDGAYDLVLTNSYLPHLPGEQLLEQLHELFPGLAAVSRLLAAGQSSLETEV